MKFPSKSSDWQEVAARLGIMISPDSALHAAGLLRARGELLAAEQAYRAALLLNAHHISALSGLVSLLQTLGRREEAIPMQVKIAEIEMENIGIAPQHRESVLAYKLASEGISRTPTRVPAAYVESLFDGYAERFDQSLVEQLEYRGPQVMAALLSELLQTDQPKFDALDIGCGTGLSGVAFRPFCKRLDGVDQSRAMLEKARLRGVYDDLTYGELLEVLNRSSQAYNLVLAADVLVYFGDLAPIFAAAVVALRRAGLLMYTVERGDTLDYALQSTGRFVHELGYLRSCASRFGFEEVIVREASYRKNNLRPVASYVVALRKI